MLLDYQNRFAFLLKNIGQIKGRVEFQKIVFILQNEGIDFDKLYSYNVYGPFSEELQYEIDDLVKSNIIMEEKNCQDGSFVYKVNTDNEVTYDSHFEDKIELVKFMGSLNRNELELIATIYYFQNLNYTHSMVKAKLEILKPSLMKEFDTSYNKFLHIKKISSKL